VDSSTGQPRGTPAKITSADDYVNQPSVTADGKKLVFSRFKPQLDVYVAELFAKGHVSALLAGSRLTTPTTSPSIGRSMTRRDFHFEPHKRQQHLHIFRQRIDELPRKC